MKINFRSKILKIFIILLFFIMISINGEFILKSNAKQYSDKELKDFYDVFTEIIDLNSGSELVNKLNQIGIDKIKDIYETIESDDFTKQWNDSYGKPGGGGDKIIPNVKDKLKFFVSEVDRVTLYNEKEPEIEKYDTKEYDKDKINELEKLKKSLSKSKESYGDGGKIDYSSQYYQNVYDTLGGILGKDFKIDTSLNTNKTPTDKLNKKIEDKIKAINSVKVEKKEVTVSNGINPDDYDPSKNPLTVEETKEVTSKVGKILGVIRNISAVVAVIIIMIIGVKYILGSVEEKANYKATMIPYIIGCVMAVAGTTIVSFIYNVIN